MNSREQMRNGSRELRDELSRLAKDPGTDRSVVLRKLASAANKRRRGQEMIDEASRDLALWGKVGAELGITMAEMTDRTTYSRELMYYLQREHGLGKTKAS